MWHTVVGIMALNFEKLSSNMHVYNIEKKRIRASLQKKGPTLVKILSHNVSGWEWRGSFLEGCPTILELIVFRQIY